MIVALILIALVVLIVAVTAKKSPKLATIFLYVLLAVGWTIQFVAKKILIAVPWIISAVVALTVGFIALGRQIFGTGNAKVFVEKFLPPRDSERETFSLTLIELMIVVHQKISSR